MAELRVAEEFAVSRETLISELEGAAFWAWFDEHHPRRGRRVIAEERSAGRIRRSVEVTLRADLPRPVLLALGLKGPPSYVEHSEERLGQGHIDWRIETSFQRERIEARGTLRVEPLGAARCRRVLEGVARVRILGVGGHVEAMIADGVSRGSQKIHRALHEWLRTKGLE